jgi:hypothetical protein
MRKNVTIGFSEEEILRLQGVAAMARMPLATSRPRSAFWTGYEMATLTVPTRSWL